MSSIQGLLALLDKIPIWKQIKELPGRIEALERRVTDLEAKPKTKGNRCPSCGEFSFIIIDSKPDNKFGDLGATRNTYECSECKHRQEKIDT